MPTPYDNHDPGFTREERRIAAMYDIDLDAVEVECNSCGKDFDQDELNGDGNCPACVELMQSEEALTFLSAPTMPGCLSLMGAR